MDAAREILHTELQATKRRLINALGDDCRNDVEQETMLHKYQELLKAIDALNER